MYREAAISCYHCYDITRGEECSTAKEDRRYLTLEKVHVQVIIKDLYVRVALQRLSIKIDPSPLIYISHPLCTKYAQNIITEY